jgi:hypothetical protein
MRVTGNSEPTGAAETQAAKIQVSNAAPAKETLALSASENLAGALKQIPEVRAEQVARAKELVNDPSYPSDAVLGKVSGLLADHIQSEINPE